MKRKLEAIVVIATVLLSGFLVSDALPCDKCEGAKCTMKIIDDDYALLDALVASLQASIDAAPDGDLPVLTKLYEELLSLQMRIEDCPTRPVTSTDVRVLDDLIAMKRRKLRGATGEDKMMLKGLISLQIRAKDCVSCARAGSLCPTCKKSPCGCASKKKIGCGKCGTPACICVVRSCCEKKATCDPPVTFVTHQTIVADNAELRGTVDGIDVATCQGPIRTGFISVEGRGKESSRFAAVLLERGIDERRYEYDGAMDVLDACLAPPPPVMSSSWCCGLTRPWGSPGCGTPVRPMVMVGARTPAVRTSFVRHGVTATSGLRRCVAWSRVGTRVLEVYMDPPDGRSFWCNCVNHRATCARLYGPDVVWELVPCQCAGTGCAECGGGGCGHLRR